MCGKTKGTCLNGTRQAIFSASLLADCNLAFSLTKTSSGKSTLYIEKVILNGILLYNCFEFSPVHFSCSKIHFSNWKILTHYELVHCP